MVHLLFYVLYFFNFHDIRATVVYLLLLMWCNYHCCFCVIIIAGVQQKLNVESGIDPFVTETFGNATDSDYFDRNFGPGKLFPGGPTCRFLGKDIPCMVRWTPEGSITSEILADALAHIDSYNVNQRKNG